MMMSRMLFNECFHPMIQRNIKTEESLNDYVTCSSSESHYKYYNT